MDENDTKIFLGLVSSSDAATYTVQVEPVAGNIKTPQLGIPLAGVFATTLGFKECFQYPVGAQVLCYSAGYGTCFIFGIIPHSDIADLQWASRVSLMTADGVYDTQNTTGYNFDASKKSSFNQNRPTDVVDGETVFSNEFGVLLGLFQGLAVLKGSELAQIQCYVFDDLVRIVSHNYEHLHALGELKIFHDGKALMAEWAATHDPRESMGVAQSGGQGGSGSIFEVDGPPVAGGKDESDFYQISEDDRTTGIARLKVFLGKLGDMVHLFLTRPDPDAVRALNGVLGGNFDTGMADIHLSLDGRISVRSVTGVSVEKTNWIMVPQRVYAAEDPQGDNATDFEAKDPFEFDNTVTIRSNPTLYFLQMRDCNAYLQDLYNYKNFLQYKKDFQMSQGSQNQENKLSEIETIDPYTKSNLGNYQLRRSGLYLMDNGGLMLKDAWGSALVMEGGDIYIQPAKDMVAQPLRNYIVKAGQFTSIASNKDVDISSSTGGMRIKTQDVLYLYSDQQGIILHSNGQTDGEPSPQGEAYTDFGGILLQAPNSGVYTYSNEIFDRAATTALYKANQLYIEASKQSLTLISAQDMQIVGEANIDIVASGNANLVGNGSVNVVAANDANFAGEGSTNLGNQGDPINMIPSDSCDNPCQYDGILQAETIIQPFTDILDEVEGQDPQEDLNAFTQDSDFTDIKFYFLSSSDYNLDSNSDFIPQTIAQQDDQAFGTLNLTEWNEAKVNDSYPFPGADMFSQYYVTAPLNNLQSLQGDIFSKDSLSLSNQAKLQTGQPLTQYKVHP